MARRCIAKEEVGLILHHCHRNVNGGHYGSQRTTAKVLEVWFYWHTLFQDTRNFMMNYDACQRSGNISKNDKILK